MSNHHLKNTPTLKFTHFVLIVLLSYGFSTTANSQERQSRWQLSKQVLHNSFVATKNDFRYMWNNTIEDKNSPIYLSTVLGLIALDKPVTTFYQNEVETNINYSLPDITIGNLDQPWLSGVDAYVGYSIIGSYVGSVAIGSETGQYFAINAFKSLAYSTIITHISLKTIFGRERPIRPLDNTTNVDHEDLRSESPFTDSAFDFFNSREEILYSSPEGSAFPSLHATAFAAVAQVAVREYDNYWGYIALSALFLTDIEDHNHWVSDLVAGTLIGGMIGNAVVDSSLEQRNKRKVAKRQKLRLTPVILANKYAIEVAYSF